MSKLIRAKIDVSKIDKTLLFKGKKGTYLDLNIWINENPDKYGNDCSIAQKTVKGEKPNYIGNGKFYTPEPVQIPVEELPPDKGDNDLPF